MHRLIGSFTAILALVITAGVVILYADLSLWKVSWGQKVIAVTFGAWLVGPPLYFLTEWTFFKGNKEKREDFKISHELARNLWIGVSLALGLLFKIKAGGLE